MGVFSQDKAPIVANAESYRVPPPPGAPHSVAIPGTQKPGRSPVYRHWRFKDGLLETLDPNAKSPHDLFETAAALFPKNFALGYRPYNATNKTWGKYQWQDYQTVQKRRDAIGKGLVELHAQEGVSGAQYGVGLWCQNRPEWQLSDLACMSQSLFTVSIYDTLGPDTTEYIINHATLTAVITSVNHIPALLKLKPRCPTLKLIICIDPIDGGDPPGFTKADILNDMAADVGAKIISLAQVEALGEASKRPLNPPKSEDIVTINYTSGTTGSPKGVVLTHRNALAAISASMITCLQTDDSTHMSYLPLAHIFERIAEGTALSAGTKIGFFHGDVLDIVDDLKELRPTGFTSVPRLFNRFGSSIKAATTEAPGFRGALSRHVVETKLANLKDYDSPKARNTHALWDRVWGRKVAAAIGLERARFMVSGSAPLDPTLHQFLRAVFGNHFIQGYGLTESYAVTLAQLEGDLSPGNCGAVASCCEACIADVEDMDYRATDKPFPRGELLIRGPTIFREYFRNEAETKKAIDDEGWFHTGDIVTIDELGRFKIIDRKKNVLKLAQGEYVSPERIENVYLANCPWLQSAYVHGDSDQTFLVMIGALAPEMFAPFASKILGKEIDPTDIEAIRAAGENEKVVKAALKELDKVGRKYKFNSFERVRGVKLMVEPFTIENELFTPTLKLKRPQTAKMYRSILDQLYSTANAEEISGKGVAMMKAKL